MLLRLLHQPFSRLHQQHRTMVLAVFSISSNREGMILDLATHSPHHTPVPMSPDVALDTPAGMRRSEFRAMGTTVSLLLPEQQSETGTDIVRTLFATWEQTLSRFLPESELSRLNRTAGEAVEVSNLLYDVLQTALEAARATGGLYDPTLFKQLVNIGYDRSFDTLPAVVFADAANPGLPGGGWRRIRVDQSKRLVILQRTSAWILVASPKVWLWTP